jgi:hypothetical protein
MCRSKKLLFPQKGMHISLLVKEGLRENFEGFLSNCKCLVLAVSVYGIVPP